MTRGFRLTLPTAAVLAIAGVFGPVSGSFAQSTQDLLGATPYIKLAQAATQQQNQLKKPPAPAVAPRPPAPAVAPRPPARVVAPTVAPKLVAPATGNPSFVAPKHVGPVTSSPNFVAPRNVGPPTGNPNFAPRHIGPTGTGNAARAVAIRGASRATIAGRNFSLWRGGNYYRVYRGGRWRTFVGLGTLGAIMFAGAMYYPYAYIDAPPELCEGFTEDGCQLDWQQVQTIDGPPDFQCVAYCPQQ